MYCKYLNIYDGILNLNWYNPPGYICNGFGRCDDGEHSSNCTATDQTKDTCINRVGLVLVHNFTKCGVLGGYHMRSNNYCHNEDLKKYQTNCTDQARVGGRCDVDGYKSTVSKYTICNYKNYKICDDHLESKCRDISKSCLNKHKHVMCDNITDCNDRSDETNPICHYQTNTTCQGRIGQIAITFNLAR